MNINTDNMQEVASGRTRTADLQYSEKTERFTINKEVQSILNLDDTHGFNVFTTTTDDGDSVIVLEVVEADEASIFRGSTPSFTARNLWTLIQDLMDSKTSLRMEPVEDNLYVLQPWDGESTIIRNSLSPNNQEDSSQTDMFDEEQEDVEEVEQKPEESFVSVGA